MSVDKTKDEVACQKILTAFFTNLDEKKYDAVLAQLTTDSVWHRTNDILQGHTQIGEALKSRGHHRQTAHFLANMLVIVNDDNTADATSYGVVYRAESDVKLDLPVPFSSYMICAFEDRLVRTSNGWRIKEKRIHVKFQA